METVNKDTEVTVGQLIKTTFTTKIEPEEYILTESEEKRVIEHAIERVKEHKIWKWSTEYMFSEMEIRSRLSQVNWDNEIDRNKILEYANSCKHQELWQQERRKQEKEEQEKKKKDLKELWTANRVYSLMKYSFGELKGGKEQLVFNDQTRHLITTLCFFISEDSRFETELNYSFSKGLMIRGTVGLGKTLLARCIEKNEINPIFILSMLEIAEEVQQTGEFKINLGDNKVLYLDDVGTEEATVNHYGTKINFFKNFIEQCYMKNKTFNKLMISTNNSFDQLEQKYGFRVRSRMKDMFNVVDIKGEDMRGKK